MEKVFLEGNMVCKLQKTKFPGKCSRCAVVKECDKAEQFLCPISKEHINYQLLGKLWKTEEIIEIISSVMVIPPAVLDAIKDKLDNNSIQ